MLKSRSGRSERASGGGGGCSASGLIGSPGREGVNECLMAGSYFIGEGGRLRRMTINIHRKGVGVEFSYVGRSQGS